MVTTNISISLILMNAALTFTGIALTSVLFIGLFGMTALIMNSAMAHTDAMLLNLNAYVDNPSESNKISLEKSINETDTFMRDISSVSAESLKKYLDTVDSATLSDSDKQSMIEAKKMLDKIEIRDPKSSEAKELKEKLNNILDKISDSD